MNMIEKINKLKEAYHIIQEVDYEIRELGFEHMLGYCYDYLSIELKNIRSGKYDM